MSAQPAGTLRGELRHDEPMARHGGWRVGGPARRFYRPADSADLVAFLATVEPGEELHWVGLGSNLLVRDGGIDGTVICLQGALDRIETLADGRVRAEAGATDAAVARHCARAGLLGVEFLAGIPGTLGGALAMNAGAHGDEIWQRVVTVETAGRDGRLRERIPSDYRIAYRSVTGPQDEWFLAATLQLDAGDPDEGQARIRALLERRGATQPTRQPSCGSVFKNPPGDFAGRLVEASGLKGFAIGGASVSTKHANFIVTEGGATAGDVEALIAHVQETVERLHGVRLGTEVRIVGKPGQGAMS
ncbi:MAG: UDP-N-acetylmuramate dehydrogenase [Gammaproteobacteria bacterium]|nr:UDP-N-acetylmuramate dehydrogenase [Gammaproteobacteria bacterium]